MTVLVTGATGFLGSRLAHRLCERGERVRALVRATSDRRRLAGLPVEQVVGDVTDPGSVARALGGVERLYHVAALYELGTADPERMEEINVNGTRNVLGLAAEAAIPAVHVSSVIALGPTGTEPATESHASGEAPRSVYQATKTRAHELACELAARGAPLRIALPVTIYGADDPSLIGRATRLFLRGRLVVGAFADTRISLVHVDDCARGLIAIAERGRDGHGYILSAQTLTFRDWFQALSAASDVRAPRAYLDDRRLRAIAPLAARLAPLAGLRSSFIREGVGFGLGAHWAFSAQKASRELDWEPRTLEDGLRESLAWYAA